MSKINYSEGLFLGKIEQDRLTKFMLDEGFQRKFIQQSLGFGLIGAIPGQPYTNAKVSAGVNPGTIAIAEGSLIDKDGNRIFIKALDNQAIVDDGNWYWVSAKYATSTIEEGIVSIDSSGTLTGVGTEFIKVLRGQPNFPTVIKFTGSVLNTIEYEVSEVTNDTTVILAGDFNAEVDLQYSVVGTFSPDEVPTESEKFPFRYDSATISISVENPLGNIPVIVEDEEFFLARVKNNGGTMVIEDKRTQFWKLRAEFKTELIERLSNPLIGVESIKFGNAFSTKDKNLITMAWGFRSTNWNINTSLNTVTLISGEGGKYKSTTPVQDNDFNGWRIYVGDSGRYVTVETTTKAGAQVNLVVNTLDPDLFTDTTAELLVVPDVDTIEFEFRPDVNLINPEGDIHRIFTFKNAVSIAEMELIVPRNPLYSYNVRYRYSKLNEYTEWRILPDDTTDGYYDETSFDDEGVLEVNPGDRNRKTYIGTVDNGYIEFIINPDAFKLLLDRVDTGDISGVNTFTLNNGDPIVDIEAGISKQEQIITASSAFTTDHFINMKTDNAKEGNFFIFHFQGGIDNGDFTLNITEDYVNAGNPGTLKKTFKQREISLINESALNGGSTGFIVKMLFNGTSWVQQDTTNDFRRAGSWTDIMPDLDEFSKVARLTIKNQGTSFKTRLIFSESLNETGDNRYHILELLVRQEAAMGGLPLIRADVINEKGWVDGTMEFVLVENSPTATIIDVYVKAISNFRAWSITQITAETDGFPYNLTFYDVASTIWNLFEVGETPIASPPIGINGSNFFVAQGVWFDLVPGVNIGAIMQTPRVRRIGDRVEFKGFFEVTNVVGATWTLPIAPAPQIFASSFGATLGRTAATTDDQGGGGVWEIGEQVNGINTRQIVIPSGGSPVTARISINGFNYDI